MANDLTAAETEAMLAASNTFEATAASFTERLRQVKQSVEGLGGTWGGKASASYQSWLGPWESEFRGVIQRLEAMVGIMRKNAGDYDDAETQNVADANTLTGGLPGV